jgi:hypothetical protein
MSNDWWSKKMGVPTPKQQPVQQYVQQPMQQPMQQQPLYAPSQQAVAFTPRCPNCSSVNYVGSMESRPRCYDCGYPIQQSGTGTPGIRNPNTASGPVEPAKQINTQNNFNPQTIIGHI